MPFDYNNTAKGSDRLLCLVPFFGGAFYLIGKFSIGGASYSAALFLFGDFSQLFAGVQVVYIYTTDSFAVSQIQMFTEIQASHRRNLHILGR